MKRIKKIGKTVAGSALLLGATLAAGAGMAAAQSGSSGDMHDLGDYPQPFVDADGNVQSTIVVGESAATADVVGAVNVAGALSQHAFTSETKSVSVSGSGGSWSASNGVTLDTRNDDLFFDDNLDTVRDTLTSQHLDALADTTFRDDNGDETDVESYLYPGSQTVQFGKPSDRSNEDPVLYVNNPSSPGSGSNLFQLQANFEDSIEFADNDVEGEEIQLFGNTYTVAEDTDSSQLVLYGSQDEVSLSYTDSTVSTTITIDGNEHTIEVDGVNSDGVIYRVDGGTWKQDKEGKEIAVGDQTIRIDDTINKKDDAGTATFAVGSEELRLQDGSKIEDGNGDDIDGTKVQFQSLTTSDNGDGDGEEFSASGIDVYVGAEDDDHEYLMGGESYSHSLFEDFEVQFGGLNPDAAQGPGDNVGEVEFSSTGDNTGTVSMMADGSSATVEFAHDSNAGSNNDENAVLADDDGDSIVVEESAAVDEDQYVATDAGDFAHLWEVTSIDRDSTSSLSSSDEATISLQDAVTGQSVEVDLDAQPDDDDGSFDSTDDYYGGTEVIDGQTYTFVLEGETETAVQSGQEDGETGEQADFRMAWGTGTSSSDVAQDGASLTLDAGSETTLYASQDTDSGAAVALTGEVSVQDGTTLQLPSTESTDSRTHTLGVNSSTSADTVHFTVGETVYQAQDSGDGSGSVSVSVDPDLDSAGDSNYQSVEPAALTVLPEDDNDNEEPYRVEYDDRSGSDGVEVTSPTFNGTRTTQSLESNSDMTVGYDLYGVHSMYDKDEEGNVKLHVPYGQSTVGAAVTGAEGSLSAEGGGSGSVETMSPAGWPDAAALDSEVSGSARNQHLIMVGGPAVNTLVSELADANKTWAGSQYSQGQAIVQQVDDAFNDGYDALVVAGYSASDTRRASSALANMDYEGDSLGGKDVAGKDMVTLTTSTQ